MIAPFLDERHRELRRTAQAFADQGFDIVAIYDRDPARVGQRLGGLTVLDAATLPAAASLGIEIGVIATPLRAAQEVAEALVAAGVRGILNFAPRKLFVPEGVALRTVDMTVELESLSFALRQARTPRRRRAAGPAE